MAASRTLVLLFSLGVLFGQSTAASFCQQQISSLSLNMNLFEELLSNYTAQARKLTPAPYVRGTNTQTPAYEFSGTGISMARQSTSDALRSASCSSSELTLYGSVFFKDSNSGGPLLDISYAGPAGTMMPVYGMYLDAEADSISLTYRHQGNLTSERFPVRLHSGRWRKFAFVLSGNLLKLFVDCREEYRRIVPLPDFCANDSSLVVTIADSAEHSEEYITGLYAYLQDVGFQFGRGGILQQCPQANESCPTCGQFLDLVQKVNDLRDELEILRLRVSSIERNSPSPPEDTASPPTSPGGMRSCILGTGRNRRTFADGEFTRASDGSICYCRDGNPSCTTITALCEDDSTSSPTSSSSVTTPMEDTQRPNSLCAPISELSGRILEVGSQAFFYEQDSHQCRVFFCQNTEFGLGSTSVLFDCTDNYTDCAMSYDPFQQNISKCCKICGDCDFASCPINSLCTSLGDSHTCRCFSGYEQAVDSEECTDIDECALGRQQLGHNCPENSTCVNRPGDFDCQCFAGFSMKIGPNQIRSCEDINECLDPNLNNCTANSVCFNTQGSFQCRCNPGYTMGTNGQCIPVCNSICQHGGQCVRPDVCNCPPGFTGAACEKDVDECETGSHDCNHARSECVNTVGGYFCRCMRGYRLNGTSCSDVDECAMRIHNCIRTARCINTIGSYTCVCPGNVSCFGYCIRHGRMIPNLGYVLEGNNKCRSLRNCTCIDGEVMCHKKECDCSRRNIDPAVNRSCCPQCFRHNCNYNGNAIRPDSTWVDPQNPCFRCYCHKNLTTTCTDISSQCPRLSCPREFQHTPSDRCCPICQVPVPSCNVANNGTTVSIRNGCKSCRCKDSNWECNSVTCPEVLCDSRDILFNKHDCCPICASQALGSLGCSS